MIPICKLNQPKEVSEAVQKVLESGRFVKGPLVEEFERQWADKCEMKYAVAVSSGSTALELVIQSQFYYGENISYTPWTYKAVPNAINRMGCHAIPLSTNPDLYAHHLHDQKPDYKPLIEDCSHCHGYKPVAETAVFSMFPAKILGACGDAGVIVTNDESVYKECLNLRNHGEPNGTNARMDEIQAAVLLAKLPYLDEWNAKRKEIVEKYDKAFGKKTPGEFFYSYTLPGSEAKKQKLIELGAESSFYYTPEYMAIPLHPFLTDEEIETIIKCVQQL